MLVYQTQYVNLKEILINILNIHVNKKILRITNPSSTLSLANKNSNYLSKNVFF